MKTYTNNPNQIKDVDRDFEHLKKNVFMGHTVKLREDKRPITTCLIVLQTKIKSTRKSRTKKPLTKIVRSMDEGKT